MAELVSKSMAATAVRTVRSPSADLAAFTEAAVDLLTKPPSRLDAAGFGRHRGGTLIGLIGPWTAHRG